MEGDRAGGVGAAVVGCVGGQDGGAGVRWSGTEGSGLCGQDYRQVCVGPVEVEYGRRGGVGLADFADVVEGRGVWFVAPFSGAGGDEQQQRGGEQQEEGGFHRGGRREVSGGSDEPVGDMYLAV